MIANLRETSSVNQILKIFPCDARANTWGEEIYFELPVKLGLESDAQQVVEPGTVCFWVEGSALALPFGPTPISKGGESRLASRCNVLGKIEGDPRELKKVKAGSAIRVELLKNQ